MRRLCFSVRSKSDKEYLSIFLLRDCYFSQKEAKMFAYVRYIEKNGTAATDKKKVIFTDEIKGFNAKKHKKNIKYKLRSGECDKEVEILLLEETKKMFIDKMHSNNNKRVSAVPAKLLISASSDSEGDVKMKKKIHDVKQKSSSSVKDYVSRKLNEFIIDSSTTQTVESSDHALYPKKPLTNSSNKLGPKILQSTTTGTCDTNNSKNGKENKLLKRVNTLPLADGPPPKEMKKVPSISHPEKKAVKILSNELVHSAAVCNEKAVENMKKKIESLQKSITSISSQLQEAVAQKENITKSKDFYKKKYQEMETEYNALLKLNQEFQVAMIEKSKEMHEMFEKLAAFQKDVPLGCSFPAIGTLRTSDNIKRYHIGNDIWLSENEYNGLLGASKKPSQLAGNITTLVFTVDELLTSNKTGFKSRRGGLGKVQCGKLDPVKLAACEGYYKYWVQNIYIPVTKDDAKNLNIDLVRYSHYAGKRIADLKKPAQKKPSKSKAKNNKITKEIEYKNIKKSNKNIFFKNEGESSDGEYEDKNGEKKNNEEKSDEEKNNEKKNDEEKNDEEESDEEKNDEEKNNEDENDEEKNNAERNDEEENYDMSDVSENDEQQDAPDHSEKIDSGEEEEDVADPLFINMNELHSATASPNSSPLIVKQL